MPLSTTRAEEHKKPGAAELLSPLLAQLREWGRFRVRLHITNGLVPDARAEAHGYLRVIDESGEDYGYSAVRRAHAGQAAFSQGQPRIRSDSIFLLTIYAQSSYRTNVKHIGMAHTKVMGQNGGAI